MHRSEPILPLFCWGFFLSICSETVLVMLQHFFVHVPIQIQEYYLSPWNHTVLQFLLLLHSKGPKYINYVYLLLDPTYAKQFSKIFPSFCFPYPEMFFIITVLKRMKYFFSSRAKLKPAEIWMLFFSVSHNQHHFTKWMDKVSYKLAEVFMATYHWLEKY